MAQLVDAGPIGRAATHAVVDGAVAAGVSNGQEVVGLTLGAVNLGGVEVGRAGGTVAALAGIGTAQEDVGLIPVFLLGEAFQGILQILDGLSILLLTEAHRAHAHGRRGRRLQLVEVLGGREEELVVIGAAFLHHDVRHLLQQGDIVGVGLKLLLVDFVQLVARGVGREHRLDVGDIAADFGGVDAVVDIERQQRVEQVAGDVVVVDDECRVGMAGTDILDGGLEVERHIVLVNLVGSYADGVSVDLIDLLDGILAQQAQVVGLHALHHGLFAEVLDTLVVHGHQLVDVGVALFGVLCFVDHGLHDGHAALIDALAEAGAVFQHLTPRLVALFIALLFEELLVQRHIAETCNTVLGGVTILALSVCRVACHQDHRGHNHDFQFLHSGILLSVYIPFFF